MIVDRSSLFEFDDLSSERLELDAFLEERKRVLASYETGQEVDLEEAIEYLSALPDHKNAAKRFETAVAADDLVLQPRAAVALIDQHIDLLTYLQDEGDADILPTQVDSYSRDLEFERAADGLEESREKGESVLNGFPFVIHGVEGTRRVTEVVDRPLCMRQVTPDIRLVTEVALAGGYTGVTSHAIDGVISFSKDYNLAKAIKHYQYVDRLAAYYTDHDVPIYREYRGMVDAVHLPPSLIIASSILEALMGAEQGVKTMAVCSYVSGHLTQEAAGLRVLRQLAEEYLGRLGYDDVTVFANANHWLGQYPQDEATAYQLINMGTVAAVLGEANELIVKTVEEGKGIPTKEGNADSLRSTRAVIDTVEPQKDLLLDEDAMEREMAMIESAARAILDKTLALGDGDPAIGTVKAFESGVLDSLLAPWRGLRNDIMIVRDGTGAMRYLDHGNLPLPEEVVNYHRTRIDERAEREGREPSYEMLVDDVEAPAEGGLLRGD
ncbi:MAG: methylaspartate mutase subunit E [Salinirussus sp.]